MLYNLYLKTRDIFHKSKNLYLYSCVIISALLCVFMFCSLLFGISPSKENLYCLAVIWIVFFLIIAFIGLIIDVLMKKQILFIIDNSIEIVLLFIPFSLILLHIILKTSYKIMKIKRNIKRNTRHKRIKDVNKYISKEALKMRLFNKAIKDALKHI